MDRVDCIPFSNIDVHVFLSMDTSRKSAFLVLNQVFLEKPLVEDGSFASQNRNDLHGNGQAFSDFTQFMRKSCGMREKQDECQA